MLTIDCYSAFLVHFCADFVPQQECCIYWIMNMYRCCVIILLRHRQNEKTVSNMKPQFLSVWFRWTLKLWKKNQQKTMGSYTECWSFRVEIWLCHNFLFHRANHQILNLQTFIQAISGLFTKFNGLKPLGCCCCHWCSNLHGEIQTIMEHHNVCTNPYGPCGSSCLCSSPQNGMDIVLMHTPTFNGPGMVYIVVWNHCSHSCIYQFILTASLIQRLVGESSNLNLNSIWGYAFWCCMSFLMLYQVVDHVICLPFDESQKLHQGFCKSNQ